jgi:hypothetical protein
VAGQTFAIADSLARRMAAAAVVVTIEALVDVV